MRREMTTHITRDGGFNDFIGSVLVDVCLRGGFSIGAENDLLLFGQIPLVA